MPYIAYKDSSKTQEIEAKNTTIADTKRKFYCATPGCNAIMSLVNGAQSEKAYFKRLPTSPKHISPFCSADDSFDQTKYDEKKFNCENAFLKLMQPSNSYQNPQNTINKITTKGGGKKAISTVKQIYLMCRQQEIYSGYNTSNILADERNFQNNENGILGKKIIQCTPYHKIQGEYAYRMNYPLFPYKKGKYIKIIFPDEKLFWNFYNKFKTTNHKELIAILGDWECPSPPNDDYISECIIYNEKQIHFL